MKSFTCRSGLDCPNITTIQNLKEEIERINDKLGNELQVKYLEIEGLKAKIVAVTEDLNLTGNELLQSLQKLEKIKEIIGESESDDSAFHLANQIEEILGDKK